MTNLIMELSDVKELLAMSPRLGTDEDIPEGTRYIQISDTLAKNMENKLDQCLDHIEKYGFTR